MKPNCGHCKPEKGFACKLHKTTDYKNQCVWCGENCNKRNTFCSMECRNKAYEIVPPFQMKNKTDTELMQDYLFGPIPT